LSSVGSLIENIKEGRIFEATLSRIRERRNDQPWGLTHADPTYRKGITGGNSINWWMHRSRNSKEKRSQLKSSLRTKGKGWGQWSESREESQAHDEEERPRED